jgi:hypothetical protein
MNHYTVERTVRIEQKQTFYNVEADSKDEACANVRDGWMEPDETEELDCEAQDDEEVTDVELETDDYEFTIRVLITATSVEYARSVIQDNLGLFAGDESADEDDSYSITKVFVEA